MTMRKTMENKTPSEGQMLIAIMLIAAGITLILNAIVYAFTGYQQPRSGTTDFQKLGER